MYDTSFRNERYAKDEHLYSTEPNSFLTEHCSLLGEPELSLSGEGRNAVFYGITRAGCSRAGYFDGRIGEGAEIS